MRDGVAVGKTIRELYPKYIKNVVGLVKDGFLSENTKLQKLQFLDSVDIFNNISSKIPVKEAKARLEIEEDDEVFERIKKLFDGKITKPNNFNKLANLVYDNIESPNNRVKKAMASLLNDSEKEIQEKFFKKSRTKYAKYISTMGDKL